MIDLFERAELHDVDVQILRVLLAADVEPNAYRLLQRLGFTREAHLRSAMKTHIGWCDTWLWGLLADEWQGQSRQT